MSKPIDLGKKWGDEVKTISMSDLKDETHYPDLHLSGDDPRLAQMPDEGTAIVKYKIVSRTHNEDAREGKKKHSCTVTMEIRSIDPPPAKEKKKKDDGARQALSDYFKDK
jgi:hypothetical protein